MITDKKELQKKIRRLRLEKANLTAEIEVFKTVGKDKFPFAYNALKNRIDLIDGMVEGIKWVLNTKSKEVKVEKKEAKVAPVATPAPVAKKATSTKKVVATKKAPKTKMEVKK